MPSVAFAMNPVNIIKKIALDLMVKKKILSMSDLVYFSASKIDDIAEIERIRRKLLKYIDKIDNGTKKGVSIALRTKLYDLKSYNSDDFYFGSKDGFLRVRTPSNADLVSKIKHIRGRNWDGTYNEFLLENSMIAIKHVEREFDIFVDIDIPEACFVAVSIDPDERLFRFLIVVEDARVDTMLNSFICSRDVSNIYVSKVETIEKFQEIMKKIKESKGLFRLMKSSIKRIDLVKKEILRVIKEKEAMWKLSSTGSINSLIKVPDGLRAYPFQIVGVKYAEKVHGRVLFADEMGLGKTVESCLFVYNNLDASLPVLVVTLSPLKISWSREVVKWINIPENDVQIIEGTKETEKTKILRGKKVYVINYNIITARLPELARLSFKTIIVDEAHMIVNRKAKRTISVKSIARNCKHVMLLTGTPVVNKPIELWIMIEITRNDAYFGGFWAFVRRYCDYQETKYGMNVSGAENLDELQRKLREVFMIRRLKKDVLLELPEKTRTIIPVDITNEASYRKASKNFGKWYLENYGKVVDEAEALIRIEKLKQLSFEGKLKELVAFIKNAEENNDKIIVFYHHKRYLDVLIKKLDRGHALAVISHGQSPKKRQKIVDAFNDSEQCTLLCSMNIGSVGLNLQSANIVVFTELGWTSAIHEQAESRAHRINQKKPVSAYYVIGKDTIEEWIFSLLEEKRKMIDEAINTDSGRGRLSDDFKSYLKAKIESSFLLNTEQAIQMPPSP